MKVTPDEPAEVEVDAEAPALAFGGGTLTVDVEHGQVTTTRSTTEAA